jgi:integrase
MCSLRWSDIDFNTNMMRIERSLKVVRGVVDEAKAKALTSQREIMLSNTTMEIYSHTFDATKKESAIAFDDVLKRV